MNIEKSNSLIRITGRIDSANATEAETKLFELCEKGENTLDCEKLEYISSAGLRVLLKLTKDGRTLKIINVSSEVYEIFDTTGFTEILDVKKGLRQIDITGLEKLGQGGNGTVYRIDADTIVKVFREDISISEIEQERECAKKAFIQGVPTAIAFDMVKVGNCYGNVYEAINSDTLANYILNNPDKFDEIIGKYSDFLKSLSQIHLDKNSFVSYKQLFLDRCDMLGEIYPKEDCELIKDIVSCMRETDTLIHGDLHPGNIMIQDGELMLIDMGEISTGPAIFDMVALHRDMGTKKSPNTLALIERTIGMKEADIQRTYDALIRKYFGTEDEEQLKKNLGPVQLLYALTAAIMYIMAPPEIRVNADSVKQRLIDGVIRPNADTLKYIISTM